ncbi:MAG: type II toxin-antitoxin system VapC family toxin [Candidatus Bathyarchaeota archaeon]|nr:type II toxin-antitoxin system VapC family toxin [Candidatus Bathyarchaeota archaeon]
MDTTFLIDLIHKNLAAEKKLSSLVKRSDGPCTTVITVAELFYGAYKSKNVAAEKENIKQVLNGFLILEMNERGAEKFGQILSALDENGQKISDRDTMIAAIATSKGENVIVTRNKKDFEKIPQLIVETY